MSQIHSPKAIPKEMFDGFLLEPEIATRPSKLVRHTLPSINEIGESRITIFMESEKR